MNYTEAVALAMQGDETGFNFLYRETYKSKYYLALKYMRNEEAAKDVVQDAYIRAFEKLDTLEEPEKFAAWLGMIVANTAKNALQKKNPVLFTDAASESAEEAFEYQIEDERTENQPEIAYSQKETQELVHQLIDSLSEEQRMCILMFHIEGQSIRDIAKALGCSENTVKSRLNYGRKNIKAQAEELQKKGCKLYNLAPVALFLYLLRSEEQALAAQGAFEAAGKVMLENITSALAQKSLLKTAGAKGAAGAVKRSFLHTLVGKLAVAGVGLCIAAAGAAIVMVISQNNDSGTVLSTAAENGIDEDLVGEEGSEADTEQETETEEAEQEITDDQYPELLEGGLTKEQFEFALAYGPESMANGEVSIETLDTLMFRIGMNGEYYDLGINTIGANEGAWKPYSLSEMNNYISVLTDYQFNEDDNDRYSKVQVSGETLSTFIVEPSASNYATIQKATMKDDIIRVEYEYDSVSFSDDTGEEVHNTSRKVATLRKTDDGAYRVTDITDAEMLEGRSEAYILTLQNLYSNRIWPDGTVVDVMGDISDNTFAVYDVDGDGEDELIIKYTSSSMAGMIEAVYGYDDEIGALYQKFSDFPALTFYDNGFIRADASHNQSDDPDAWPYTMYQYNEDARVYEAVGSGVTNDGSIQSYVGNGKEVKLPFLSLTKKHIKNIK